MLLTAYLVLRHYKTCHSNLVVLSLSWAENILVLNCRLDRQAFERLFINLILRFILLLSVSDRIGLYALMFNKTHYHYCYYYYSYCSTSVWMLWLSTCHYKATPSKKPSPCSHWSPLTGLSRQWLVVLIASALCVVLQSCDITSLRMFWQLTFTALLR